MLNCCRTSGAHFLCLLACAAVGILAAGLPSAAEGRTVGGVRLLEGSLRSGAEYKIEVPRHWNGTLFLFSHGYVVPDGFGVDNPNPATDGASEASSEWLLRRGFALAGSSFAKGWAIREGLADEMATFRKFKDKVGRPSRTIAWGGSLGGEITAGLVQRHPNRFDGALSICGVLSGSVGFWNLALDSAFAFKTLLAPDVVVTGITDPVSNWLAIANPALQAAQQTPQGRARIALVAALSDSPGFRDPLAPAPAPDDYEALELAQFQWASNLMLPYAFALRSEVEQRAGGNPSWNTGVDYVKQLRRSVNETQVRALYRDAGLSLKSDLETLNDAQRIGADASAVRYMERNIAFNGKLSAPMLTLHTTEDWLVGVESEQAYDAVVSRAGNSKLLRQIYVRRNGHCMFTNAEVITGIKVLLHRVRTGRWKPTRTDHATDPDFLNASAAALGPDYNSYPTETGEWLPLASAFKRFRPSPFLRPHDLQR